MARGVVKSVEVRIGEIEDKKLEYQARIDHYREKIAELDRQIKELRDVQKEKKLEELLEAIESSGKTVEDVLSIIQ